MEFLIVYSRIFYRNSFLSNNQVSKGNKMQNKNENYHDNITISSEICDFVYFLECDVVYHLTVK